MLMLALLPLLCAAASAGAADPSCLIIRDVTAAQDVKIEAHGANALRVRAVPSGGQFKDDPDVVSAFTPLASAAAGEQSMDEPIECVTVALDAALDTFVSSGNLKAAVGADGKLVFTRISDGRVLLHERSVRTLKPTTTVPPVGGFLSLDYSFEAVEGERIYGLGQHAAFSWDKNFPVNGQLDQKGVPEMLLEPHGELSITATHAT